MAVTIIGGITTAIAAVVGVIRGGKTAAVEAAEKAVSTVREAMETQGAEVTDLRTRVTNQDTQITTLGSRVEDVTKRHGVAVSHIAEREDAADEHLGPGRPAWLPPGPRPHSPGRRRRETATVVFGVWVERRGVPFAGSPSSCRSLPSPHHRHGDGGFAVSLRKLVGLYGIEGGP